MGTLYIDTGGSATNSGSTDTNSATVSGAAATIAGSVVTLDGSPDLSATVTSGATQSSIYIADATNTNQKIFWITAFDDTLNTVTVSVAPTGVTSSAWAIGGRHVWTQASFKGGLRAGDEVIVNNAPAAAGAIWFSPTVAGSSAAGRIKVRGKTGVRPLVNVTNTARVIDIASLNPSLYHFENLELDQDGASGDVIGNSAGASGQNLFLNIKISDGGGHGINKGTNGQGDFLVGCEIFGTLGSAVNLQSGAVIYTFGSNLHDNGADGLTIAGTAQARCQTTIFDSNTGRGILDSSAMSANAGLFGELIGCTIYGNGNSGLEVTDTDMAWVILSSIFSENGNAAGRYNVEVLAGSAEQTGFHYNNIFYHSGGGGGANLSALTTNSTEFTTDPLFTNPSGSDFSLGQASPAISTGFPSSYLGANTNYLDIGAVQRQPTSGQTATASVS